MTAGEKKTRRRYKAPVLDKEAATISDVWISLAKFSSTTRERMLRYVWSRHCESQGFVPRFSGVNMSEKDCSR